MFLTSLGAHAPPSMQQFCEQPMVTGQPSRTKLVTGAVKQKRGHSQPCPWRQSRRCCCGRLGTGGSLGGVKAGSWSFWILRVGCWGVAGSDSSSGAALGACACMQAAHVHVRAHLRKETTAQSPPNEGVGVAAEGWQQGARGCLHEDHHAICQRHAAAEGPPKRHLPAPW